MVPVEVIRTALDINLFTEGIGGVRSRIERAKSTLEFAALTTGFVQANAAVTRLLVGGPDVSDAIDVMIKDASAHPSDAQAFQAVIRRYLEGEGALGSPIALAPPSDSDATRPSRGVGEVRRALGAELAQLASDLAASPPDPAVANEMADFVRELSQAVKRSTSVRQEVRLPGTASATAPNALGLGSIAQLNSAWTHALGQYDRDRAIEQVVSVVSMTGLGVSYLTVSTTASDATRAGIRFANTVASALDIGSFAFERTFTTSARAQVNTLPHEMVLTLAPELANLWRLVRAVENIPRGQSEAADSAEPGPEAKVGASAAAGNDQLEITMRDGSVLRGRLDAAKLPFVSGYGPIEVATGAITSFAEGRLRLEDGSMLKGAFGDGEVDLATSHGNLRIPADEIVAIACSGTTGPAAVKPPSATVTSPVAQEQAVLVGQVLNQFKQPVSGATVRVLGSSLRATTDAQGNYRLPYVAGKFRVMIEKVDHDHVQIEFDLAQTTTYPVDDKHLTLVPRLAGVYFQGQSEWLSTASCQVERVESKPGSVFPKGEVRYVVRGSAKVIAHDGASYLLNLSGADTLVLLPIAADGAIWWTEMYGGWSGWRQMWLRSPGARPELGENWNLSATRWDYWVVGPSDSQ